MADAVTRSKRDRALDAKKSPPALFGRSHEEERAGRRQMDESEVEVNALLAERGIWHSRDGKRAEEETVGLELIRELAAAVAEALEAQSLAELAMAMMLERLERARSVADIYRAFADHCSAAARLEILEHVAAHLGWHKAAPLAEELVPVHAVVESAMKLGALSMRDILHTANEEGPQSAQLGRYAAALAGRFLDDDFRPVALGPLDPRLELMSSSSRRGIEDAIRTYESLGTGAAALRHALIVHYGGLRQAEEQLALELLKRAEAL